VAGRSAHAKGEAVGGGCCGEFVKVIHHRNNPMEAAGEGNVSGSRSWNVQIPAEGVILPGQLEVPASSAGIVLFAHRGGSGRHSPRNQAVARTLRSRGIGTLLFDLWVAEEKVSGAGVMRPRLDFSRLAVRLLAVTDWVARHRPVGRLGLGYFGASTGGAVALVAAAACGVRVQAVVARGTRTDGVGDALQMIHAPALLIAGECDPEVLEDNRQAYAQMKCEKELAVIPEATHLFEEPGALDEVATRTADGFSRHLATCKDEAALRFGKRWF